MAKTLHSDRHRRLAELLTEKRKLAGLTQAAVAKALNRHQPFIANIENADRRVDLIEFLDLAKVVGFDPYEVLHQIEAVDPQTD
ncbi:MULTISPECIES: helix-turn-helix transcriptional regulator [unclassified Mesorhizobium]|uniref:helix-turn-helix domain-containing protein n=1 Tax=unclassified Mesorhizobium TaxID=325217 RepID=UPI000A008B69|nr:MULTISPECIES: helix-turn-helix transcriptional regulator [unclassified Mesorhizobium]WJI80826.1 helix-turn-helix domain-containing protein [Mesorhizobium sp. C374B]WJI87365.1 helix-turn-helix domain-containing protein [Mesorhizobium sp. C372A]